MIAISFKFTGGRFHATPWGRHVNEGAVEWPPEPWRILRALLATGYKKLGWNTQNAQPDAITLLGKLASDLPAYHLPAASLGHARYFMPAPETRTKIFDAFVAIPPDDPLVVIWKDTKLSPDEEQLLKQLLLSLSYLGRAESWVTASLLKDWDGVSNCEPLNGFEKKEGQRIRLLAAQSAGDYAAWRNNFLEKELPKEEKTKNKNSIAVPENIWYALHVDTAMLQKDGWSAPPGSRWVEYCGPQELFSVKYQARRSTNFRPTVARYALSGSVLPLFTDALFLGERMRQALMSNSRKICGTEYAHPIFSGKTEDGHPCKTVHKHAFFLPSDEDSDGRIDHITVYAIDGFDEAAQRSLSAVRKLWGNSGHDIYVALVGLGEPKAYGGFHSADGLTPQLTESSVWESFTPFVLTRHLKTKRSERHDPRIYSTAYTRELEKALVKELERIRTDLPAVEKIEHIHAVKLKGSKSIPWHRFKRQRANGGGKQSSLRGHGFRITFKTPVKGPLMAGYACHFGLGQFVAIHEKK